MGRPKGSKNNKDENKEKLKIYLKKLRCKKN